MLLVTLFSRCFPKTTTHFQHRKLWWMKLLFLNITLPTHSEKNMQTAVKRTMGKEKPQPKTQCVWCSSFVWKEGTWKSAIFGSREHSWNNKKNMFLRCPLSVETLLPSPFFCLPALARPSMQAPWNTCAYQADAFKWKSSFCLFSFSVQSCEQNTNRPSDSLALIQSEKDLCFVQRKHHIGYLSQLEDCASSVPSPHIFNTVHTNLAQKYKWILLKAVAKLSLYPVESDFPPSCFFEAISFPPVILNSDAKNSTLW